jgi:hypothetical protein
LSNTSGVAESGSGDFEVFCGIDVAREVHHAVALDDHGQRLIDRPLPPREPNAAVAGPRPVALTAQQAETSP